MDSSASKPKRSRPVGVTIVGIVAIAGGVFSLLGGVSVLSGMASGLAALAIIVIVFGFLGLALGAGLLIGKPWARTPAIIVYLASIGLGVAEIVYGGMVGELGGIARIIAGILFPIYLMRPNPKAFFS